MNNPPFPLTAGTKGKEMSTGSELQIKADVSVTSAPEQDEEIDVSPLLSYLQSPQGHEIASRVITLIEDVKKAAVDKNYSHAKFNRWVEFGVIVAVILAVVGLSVVDKLNPTVGVLLGSVVGYFFGKNK